MINVIIQEVAKDSYLQIFHSHKKGSPEEAEAKFISVYYKNYPFNEDQREWPPAVTAK